MKLLLLLSTVLVAAEYGLQAHQHWISFKLAHGKEYKDLEEERFRRSIYIENQLKIKQHNEKYKEGLVPFRMGMNHFGDLTNQEFRSMMNLLKDTKPSAAKTFQMQKNMTLPSSVDWRKTGAVTSVKDQGKCGACWSFSSTGALEAQHFLKTGKLISLSEQNLIDCSGGYGNDGCAGGLMHHAFEYVVANKGVDTENSYPYEGLENDCRFVTTNVGTSATGFVIIQQGDEEALRQAVATIGPISAGVDGNHHSFQFYKGGLYHDKLCTQHVNHAVLIVGYGTDESGQDYWLLKNSWNSSWGEGGYARLARNLDNHCGIANKACYPLI